MNLLTAPYPSPPGPLTLVSNGRALHAILWAHEKIPADALPASDEILTLTARQLDEYFAHARTTFKIPLAPRGTDFQRQVWHALQQIPHAQTTSYAHIAKQIHRPSASRAVGAAIGANPFPILIPCHRVLGSTGKLTGFAGGLKNKSHLLSHESKSPLLLP